MNDERRFVIPQLAQVPQDYGARNNLTPIQDINPRLLAIENEEYNALNFEGRDGIVINEGRGGIFSYKVHGGRNFVSHATAAYIYSADPNYDPAWNQFQAHDAVFPFGAPRTLRSLPNLDAIRVAAIYWTNSEAPITRAVPHPIVSFLIPFVSIQGFTRRYNRYVSNPDSGVDFIDHGHRIIQEVLQGYPESPQIVREGGNPEGAVITGYKTLVQTTFAIHIFVLSCYKSFRTAEHVLRFVNQRIRPFNQATLTYEVTEQNVREIFDPEFIIDIQGITSQYPKLRTMIFELVITSQNNIFSHTKSLLHGVGNTIPLFINSFLNAGVKTQAHVHETILREAVAYCEAVLRLQEIWGNFLPYIRALDPSDHSLETRHWPNLALVSYMYCYRFNANTLRNFTVSLQGVTVPNIARMLSRTITDRHFLMHQGEDDRDVVIRYRHVFRTYGINPETFQDNLENYMEDREALELFQGCYDNIVLQRQAIPDERPNAAAGLNAARNA